MTLLGEWKNKTHLLLEELNSATKFEFHLTGSRFFGNSGTAADYDFFCQVSPEVEEFLATLGFKIQKGNCYNGFVSDINTAVVYKTEGIDVQLVKHVDLKIELQTALKFVGKIPPRDKSLQRVFWDNEYSKFFFAKELERRKTNS